MDRKECSHCSEQIQGAYYDASHKLGEFIRTNEAETVRNLLEQYLVGVFDVGVTEGLTLEEVQGVTKWLEDMLLAAEHLDLTQRCEPGDAPAWS